MKKKDTLTIINTNSRSLCPKIDSLVQCFKELDVDIAVITETWLKDGVPLDDDLRDLEIGAGLGSLVLNRKPNPRTGDSHGGVGIFYRKAIGNFKPVPLFNPDCFEVLPSIATIKGSARKLVVMAAYIPPNYPVPRAKQCLEYIENCIIDIKRIYRDPYIVVAGDFNQWEIDQALAEFVDLREVHVGPTRGDRAINRLFCNMTSGMSASGTVPPLETAPEGDGPSSRSDHLVTYMTTKLPRREAFEWVTYTYRQYSDEARDAFGGWVVLHDWMEVITAEGSHEKAVAYQATIDSAMDRFFPLRTVRKKSTDLPWMTKGIKKKIRRRKRIYRKEGFSLVWRRLKKTIDDTLKERKRKYMERKKQELTAEDANRYFFRLVKSFNTPEKPQNFDVRALRPGVSDEDVAEELADFFNRISLEFDPLSDDQIPRTHDRRLPPIRTHEVSSRIKHFRKPKSMVKGDVFPAAITKYCDFFAIPLANIYSEIAVSGIWPATWKTEYVTVIPKTSSPESFGDLRNISCTLLASKIMESYVLDWATDEVTTKYNQYGGVRGCSGTHLIIKVWQKILSNLEDRRAATALTSIDYAKAFNRLSFQHCLKSFAKKGSSTSVIRLLASFLSGRSMQVRVGSSWSRPRSITGGCPQGSILGVFLFNVTVDDLEDGSAFVSNPGAPEPEMEEDFYRIPADNPEGFLDATGHSDDTFHSALSDPDQEIPLTAASSPGTILPSPPASPMLARGAFRLRLNSSSDVPFDRRINYSSEGDLTPPPEPTQTCLGQWRTLPVDVDKYVDDNIQEERINMENAVRTLSQNTELRTKHAVATQNVFRHVIREAERKGMKVNAGKTNMICISDSLTFKAACYIEDSDGVRIDSSPKMKVLGFHFSERPTVEAYIAVLTRRFRERYWTLRHLKHNGFGSADLVRVYTSIIRPVADYMQEVYHPMLTDRQDENIERLQNHALKCIYGPRLSGRRMREMAELPTLRDRRIEACDKFAAKCVDCPRFGHWFPRKEVRRSTRKTTGQEFLEEFARCDRLYYSPIFYMRRRLNGKPGKICGVRNAEYRA